MMDDEGGYSPDPVSGIEYTPEQRLVHIEMARRSDDGIISG